uniref:Uncharacterized protein n=1 Tax=Setaria viridis TaxID=4556 RepID=A0A4U6SRL0_SETVI|nr:hypothetical protein SEVIR_9G056366v2 [Setaria viridis]
MVVNSSHYIADVRLQLETFTSHPGTEPFASDSDVTCGLLLLFIAAAQSGGTSGSLNRPLHWPLLCRHYLESNNAAAISNELVPRDTGTHGSPQPGYWPDLTSGPTRSGRADQGCEDT